MHDFGIQIITVTSGSPERRAYTRAQLDSHHDRAQACLKRAKRDQATIACQCQTPPVPMHIKYRHGRYVLCRNPNTGKQHHPLCPSYAEPDELSGRGSYSEQAVKNIDDEIVVSPEFSLTMSKSTLAKKTILNANASSKKRNTVTLLGVLQLIYARAGFHRWYPKMKGKRNYARFAYYVEKSLASMRFSRGRSMQDSIVIASSRTSIKSRLKTICFAGEKSPKRLGLVIGSLLKVKKAGCFSGKQTYALIHRHDHQATPCYLSEAMWLNSQRSYLTRRPCADDFMPISEVQYITVSLVSMNQYHSIIVEQCAFMPVTRDFIPYESSYERQVAEALVEQNRAFIKPLRYDSQEVTFPDFVLHDTPTPTPMEIYGMVNHKAYASRKQDKNIYYKKHYPHFWSWDLAMTQVMPDFPPSLKPLVICN